MSDDLDVRLREYAARWREGADEAAPRAVDPASRASRTWFARPTALAVAASIVVVALIAGGVLLATRHHHTDPTAAARPGAVVPWSSAGVRPDTTPLPDAAKVPAPNGTRPCSSSGFVLVSSQTELAASNDGWLTTSFLLRSVAAASCSVPNGRIGIALLAGDGTTLPVDPVPIGGPILIPPQLLVRPGQLVAGVATWAVYAGRAPRPTALVIDPGAATVRTTDRLRVPLHGVAIPPHPRDPSNSGPWRSTSFGSFETVTDPGGVASLSARISAPSSVPNGSVLRYRVTLSNPTRTPVALDPCPTFVERVDVVAVKIPTTVGFRGSLNCPAAPKVIGAEESVTFAVELDTKGEILGGGRLSWQLADATGTRAAVTADAELTIRTR